MPKPIIVRPCDASAADDGVDREAVIRIARQILCSDIRRLFNPDGTPLPIHKLDDDTAAAIASIEIDSRAQARSPFWSKVDALDLVMRHAGLFGLGGPEEGAFTTTLEPGRHGKIRH
jgi:hypothetical protein